MADRNNDELSVEELEGVAGGNDTNSGCTSNGNCPCAPTSEPIDRPANL